VFEVLSLRDWVGVAVVVIAVLNWLRDRRPYSVCWSTMLDWPLFERDGWKAGDLAVTLGTDVLDWPRVAVIRVDNRGKHPVRDTDYAEPLRISIATPCRILFAQALSRTVDVANLCAIDGQDIVLARRLLNPGEWFLVHFLVDSKAALKFRITGRLAGVVRLEERGIRVRDRIDYAVLAVLVVGIFAFLALVLPPTIMGHSSIWVAAFSGSVFTWVYELSRRMRYVLPNAQAADLLINYMRPLWFTSRISI
jgi:hypothetical protein